MEENPQNLTKKERREMRRGEQRSEAEKARIRRGIRRSVLWSGIVLVLVGGVYGMVRLGSGVNNADLPLADAVSPSDWTLGNRQAKVILVEYSDFQCPACKIYMPMVEKVMEEYKDRALFAYRHLPLKSIHKNAESAARAAEAAGRQGVFWQMADLLFQNQAEWENSSNADEIFAKYASRLNIGTERFKADMNSPEIKNKVNADYASALGMRLNSTPSFFLNGVKIKNPNGYDEFRNIIAAAIAANS